MKQNETVSEDIITREFYSILEYPIHDDVGTRNALWVF